MSEKDVKVNVKVAGEPLLDDIQSLKSLGSKSTDYDYPEPSQDILEVFPNRAPGRDYVVTYKTREYTARCPKTKQPDYGTITIEYIPDKWCIETKSLKLYIFAFRDHGIFMETAVNKILDDCVAVSKPKWMKVTGEFEPRGGIYITVEAEYGKKPEEK